MNEFAEKFPGMRENPSKTVGNWGLRKPLSIAAIEALSS